MSIQSKIIAVVAASLLAGVAVMGTLFERNYRAQVARASHETLLASRGAFVNLRKDSVDMMSAAVEALVSNDRINTALAHRDRRELLAVTAPLYQSYRQHYGITHWSYWEPETEAKVKGLVNFLRTATPDKYGELVERSMLAQAVTAKRLVYGLELGNTGFAFRVVAPVYREGRLCGYFEMGKDVGSFLESMQQQTGSDYGLLLDKSWIDEAKWRSSRASRGQRDNWADSAATVLAKNTSRDESIFAYDGHLATLADEGMDLGVVTNGARTLSRSVFPLYEAGGAKAGGVFVLTDITAMHDAARLTMWNAFGAMVVLMSLAGVLMCILFRRLIVKRLERLIRVATRVVGGEFHLEVVPSARDEVGKFEELFEQFRRVFVDLVNHAETAPEHAERA